MALSRRHLQTFFAIAGTFCWTLPITHAQTPKAPSSDLASQLAKLPPDALPKDQIILVVGANSVNRTQPLALAPSDTTLASLAEHYGRKLQTFETVTALAPATMVVLNTHPDASVLDNVAYDLRESLKDIFASSSPDQLRQLTSKDGLGINDLSEGQRRIFLSAASHSLEVVPYQLDLDALWDRESPQDALKEFQSAIRTISPAQLEASHLHGQLTMYYTLNAPSDKSRIDGVDIDRIDSHVPDPDYKTDYNTAKKKAADLTEYLKPTVPNTLKISDLNWENPALAAKITLANLKTVGDLITQIAKATKLELYCDPHFASKTLTLLGQTDKPRTACDILQGICLCLTATWRKVGPAYVLTDDLLGGMTRREMINDSISSYYQTKASNNMTWNQLDTHLLAMDWPSILTFPSDDHWALPMDTILQAASQQSDDSPSVDSVSVEFGKLPSDVQKAAHEMLAVPDDPWVKTHQLVNAALTPDYDIRVNLSLVVTLEVPNIGTVDLNYTNIALPIPTKKQKRPENPKPVKVAFQNRGILCAPETPEQARSVIDRMAELGFNTFYCDVFTDGRTYFPNPIIPPSTPTAPYVLKAAIDEGRKKQISVIAVLDALRWRNSLTTHTDDPLKRVSEDLTVTQESADTVMEREWAGADKDSHDDLLMRKAFQSGGWVDPVDPASEKILTDLIKTVAVTPGLTGLLLQDTINPGNLGYSPFSRLAFLRSAHIDPVDLSGDNPISNSIFLGGQLIELSLPNYGSLRLGFQIQQNWAQLRWRNNRLLVTNLLETARTTNPNLPIWLRSQPEKSVTAYRRWTTPDNLGDITKVDEHVLEQGAVLSIPFEVLQSETMPFKRNLWETLKWISPDKNKSGSSIVFDLVTGSTPKDPVSQLNELSSMIQFPSQ